MPTPIRSRFLTVQPISELALPFPIFPLPLLHVPVASGVGSSTVEPPLIAVLSVHAPEVVPGSISVYPDTISIATVLEPTIEASGVVSLPPFAAATVVYLPSMAYSQIVEPGLIAATVLHEPNLAIQQLALPDIIQVSIIFHEPTLVPSATIFTPPNPTTPRLWEPVVIREQFVATSLLSISAVYGPTVTLAYDQTVYPSRFPLRTPYYITAVVHEPGVGTYVPESHANPVYIYANVEVNQDVPADIGTNFAYIYTNVGINRANDADDNSIHYLYVNPVWFVQMPMIFLLSTAQPLEPGSGLSGWGILPAAIQEYD